MRALRWKHGTAACWRCYAIPQALLYLRRSARHIRRSSAMRAAAAATAAAWHALLHVLPLACCASLVGSVATERLQRQPTACSGAPAVVDGHEFLTRVFLVQDGVGPPVAADNSRLRLSVKANLEASGGTGPSFPFEFNNPYQVTKDPKRDGGMIVGFDVGMWPTNGRCSSPPCGFTKDSTRVFCIPPEEGYGSTPRPGIPANSTLLIEVKLLEILPPLPPIKCNPHASPVEHCPDGGSPCPSTGVCPAPPAPAPPPAPPGPPLPPAPPTGKCLGGLVASDCQAWTELFDATAGAKWTACSDKRLDPCSCQGPVDPTNGLHRATVTCTTTTLDTRMTSLDLGPNNLVGTLPPSIGNLTALTELGFFENSGLTGTIPSAVGRKKKGKLQVLFLFLFLFSFSCFKVPNETTTETLAQQPYAFL